MIPRKRDEGKKKGSGIGLAYEGSAGNENILAKWNEISCRLEPASPGTLENRGKIPSQLTCLGRRRCSNVCQLPEVTSRTAHHPFPPKVAAVAIS
jgi:hypothetical protein